MSDPAVASTFEVLVETRHGVDVHLLAGPAPLADSPCVVLAHGAGGDMHQDLLVHLQSTLAGNGYPCARFNFPYAQAGRRSPDRAPRLLATWRAVLASLRERLACSRWVLGGKSMGGRMASMLVAEGEPAAGLLLLGYPLHPAGRPERLRDAHFGAIVCPCLFVQGTRDRLCDPVLLARSLERLGGAVTLYTVEQGDHSFEVPRRAGLDAASIRSGIDDAVLRWIRAC